MSVTFRVLDSDHDDERREIRVTGTLDDGILVTGMSAVGEGCTSTVQEIEMLPDADRGTVFRLTFSTHGARDPDGWASSWAAPAELTLEY